MALGVQLLSPKMNRLVVLILILFSYCAFAASSGSFDSDDVTPVKPAAKPAPAPAAKPEVKPAPAAKPAAKPDNDDDDDDDDDDDEEEEVKPAPKRKDDGYQSPSRDRARNGGSFDERKSEGGYCKYCGRATEDSKDRITVRYKSITAPQDVMNSRIWGTFKRNFEECAPGCQPIGMSSYRDPHARPKPSCHHQSAAIDVFGMRCDGRTYTASKETSYRHGPEGRFTDTVRCMKRKGMYLIYNQADHYDHAHLSLGCNIGGWRYY